MDFGNILWLLFDSLLFTLFYRFPVFLTLYNIVILFKKNIKHKALEKAAVITTFVVGILYTLLLSGYLGMPEWNKPLAIGNHYAHTYISGNYPIIVILSVIGILGYIILRTKRFNMPPLVTAICMSSVYIGCILSIAIILQLSVHNNNSTLDKDLWYRIYLALLPFNYIIISARLIKEMLMTELPKDNSETYDGKFPKIHKILSNSKNLPVVAIVLLVPILSILMLIMVLFGQQPDSAIRAFTETSEWLFSTKVSPEPIAPDGHYLCTVAAGGHEKLVKPLRMGERRGHKIIVNRQLCVANAFEELINEKAPKFHHFIRHIYNKYGYPVSKHIKTPLAADITYIIMKPLEYFFVVVLYLFDKNPENRIASQYSPLKKQEK